MATARNEIRTGGGKPSNLPVKRYHSYQDMLADKDIDAVMIATPDHHHAPISIAAIKAGKHVYCEKSPVHNEKELYELYETVKSSNLVYQLGHQIPHSVIFQQAKEIIAKNILGKISLVETTTNRNSAEGAWIRHLDKNGKPKPGDEKTIDWEQWLGNAPKVPTAAGCLWVMMLQWNWALPLTLQQMPNQPVIKSKLRRALLIHQVP